MKRGSAALILACLLSTAAHAAAAPTASIRLQHRPAEDVVPLVRPLVAHAGGTVTGRGHTVLLAADAAALPRLERLIKRLDVPLRRLVVTVSRIDHRPAAAVPGTSILSTRDVDADADPTAAGPGGRVLSTRPLEGDTDQRLQVVEGRWASVATTRHVPEVQQQIGLINGTQQLLSGLTYHDLTTGFAVRPLVDGDHVTVDVRIDDGTPDDGTAGGALSRSVTTTVTGRLGRWLEISAAAPAAPDAQGATSGPVVRAPPLFIRVDESR